MLKTSFWVERSFSDFGDITFIPEVRPLCKMEDQ